VGSSFDETFCSEFLSLGLFPSPDSSFGERSGVGNFVVVEAFRCQFSDCLLSFSRLRRATRRASAVEASAGGGWTSCKNWYGGHTNLQRAIARAGLSRDQANTMMRVACVPPKRLLGALFVICGLAAYFLAWAAATGLV
jgi:hypothetical protein